MGYNTTNKYVEYSINTSVVNQFKEQNYSIIRISVSIWRTNKGYPALRGTGTVYFGCNGQTHSVNYTTPISEYTSNTVFASWDVRVNHDSSGEKTVNVSARVTHSYNNLSSNSNGYDYKLPTIPRASNFNVSGKYIDKPISISWDKKDSSFRYTLNYSLDSGNNWTEFVNLTSSDSATLNVPIERIKTTLGSSADGWYVTIQVATINSQGGLVGYYNKTVLLMLDDSVKPTITSVNLTDLNTFNDTHIKGISNVKLNINALGDIYGSTIKTYQVACKQSNFNYNGVDNTYTSPLFNASGINEFVVTVTDSRGRKSSQVVKTVDVKDYKLPSIDVVAFRCDNSGIENNAQENIAIKVNYEVDTVGGNYPTVKNIYINESLVSSSYTSGSLQIFKNRYSIQENFTIKVELKDSISNLITITKEVSKSGFPISFKANRQGVSIGEDCVDDGFTVAWDSNFKGEINQYGIPIIESYTNKDTSNKREWTVIKYANGDMIQIVKKLHTGLAFNNKRNDFSWASNTNGSGSLGDFPEEFVEIPSVTGMVSCSLAGYFGYNNQVVNAFITLTGGMTKTTPENYQLFQLVGSSTVNIGVIFEYRGKWK